VDVSACVREKVCVCVWVCESEREGVCVWKDWVSERERERERERESFVSERDVFVPEL